MAQNNKLLDELTAATDDLLQKGHTTIPIHGLKAFLKAFHSDEAVGKQERLETERRAHELSLETWKTRASIESAQALEMFKSVIEAGGSALRAAMLLNGGAAIALLTFLGNAWAKHSEASMGGVNEAMVWFFGGTLAAGSAYLARYVTQFCYQLGHQRTAFFFHGLAFIAGAISIGVFALGGYHASSSFAPDSPN